MNAIKPIETHYNGYRFRSRLEARWAVLWDALGFQWEYEPEGYILPDGTRYLPDFWLPEIQGWYEVKPGNPSDLAPEAFAKPSQLMLATGQHVAIVCGIPQYPPEQYGWVAFESNPNGSVNWGKLQFPDLELYVTAVTAARSARFEWGQNG